MAVTGMNNISVLETSYHGESHSMVSRKWGNQDRPITSTSYIRKMWRELEGENRYNDIKRQQPSGVATGSQCSFSSGGAERGSLMINASEVENRYPWDQNQTLLQNGQEDKGNMCLQRSPALCIADKQRVRQVFCEWGSKNSSGAFSGSHSNSCSRAIYFSENECKKARTVRKWIESNTQQTETGHFNMEEQAATNGNLIEVVRDGFLVNHTGVGAQRSVCRIYGRQALLDLLTWFKREREREVQTLTENRPVSTFAHRNRIQSLLRGRFLWNQRFVHNEKCTSFAASELGILRQTQTVSDLRKEFLSRLDNSEHIHDGSQSDTSPDDGMKFHQENIQEPPDDIANDVETTNTSIDLSGTHKVDYETNTCGSPPNYAASVGEMHELVLEEEERQPVTLTEFIENIDQDQDQDLDQEGLLERNQGPSTMWDGQYQSNGDELEVHEAFDHLDSSEINEDGLSWEEGSAETEGWRAPLVKDDGTEWHQLTNIESNMGDDANSNENEDDWYQETAGSYYQESQDGWYDNAMEDATESWFGSASYPPVVRTDAFYASDDGNSNRLELRELMSRRSVSNLLQSDFRERLDQVLQSYVERQDQASESDDEWMADREQQDNNQQSIDENDNVIEVVERTEGSHSSSSAISQTHQDNTFLDEWEIINGLRTDMITLQERMNSMQRTLETCMNMQLELQRSVQQEVSSALNRLSTSGEDECKADCVICDDGCFDSSPKRRGDVLICSKCAENIDWSRLKESVRHP